MNRKKVKTVSYGVSKEISSKEVSEHKPHDDKKELPTDRKVILFITDYQLDKKTREAIDRLNITIFKRDLFKNVSLASFIRNADTNFSGSLMENTTALWIYLNKAGARWLSENYIKKIDQPNIIKIAVFRQCKNQKFIRDVKPDIVMKRTRVEKLLSYSLEHLLERIDQANRKNEIHISENIAWQLIHRAFRKKLH